MTLDEYIREVAARLVAGGSYFGHGTETAEAEAAWLLGSVCSLEDLAAELDAASRATAEQLLDKRIRLKVPTAYLLGHAWFCGLKFAVTPDVLIPRSPIPELISSGFEPWVDSARRIKALDLCTGSGCIAIAMACSWPHWQVNAADISAAAVVLAKANCDTHGVSGRVEVLEGDLWRPCGNRRYDLIVANPPYVASSEYAILPPEYLSEPALGLLAGEDGLDLVYRILSQAARHLTEQGILVCEVGHADAALIDQMPLAPFMWLEFQHGGKGVFMLDRQQLVDLGEVIERNVSERKHVQ